MTDEERKKGYSERWFVNPGRTTFVIENKEGQRQQGVFLPDVRERNSLNRTNESGADGTGVTGVNITTTINYRSLRSFVSTGLRTKTPWNNARFFNFISRDDRETTQRMSETNPVHEPDNPFRPKSKATAPLQQQSDRYADDEVQV